MGRPRITLYLDTVSPFGYLAFHILRNSPVFAGCDVTYVPVFLGGIMTMCNNAPPINIKNKAAYIHRQRNRWAELFDVPINPAMPPNFPPLTLTIMRPMALLHSRADASSQAQVISLFDSIYHAFFVDHAEPHKAQDRHAIFTKVLGSEEAARKLEEDGQTQEAKEVLKKNTQEAFDKGAFGLPWMVCTNADGKEEGFFGVDSLGQVAQFLGLERPDSKGWKSLL
ncbi:putative 2-hydroxychromene-2-carboxylate isomerase [Sarocladium strictum]